MTKSSQKKLEYQKAYNARQEEVKKRVANNKARRTAIKEGTVKVGDGKEVDHIKPLESGGSNAKSNLRVVDEKTNAGWRKGQSGYNPGAQKK